MITFRSKRALVFFPSFDPYYQILLMLSFSHFIPLTEDWNHIQGCACVCEKETETEMERERERIGKFYSHEHCINEKLGHDLSFFLCTPDQLPKQDNSTLGWIKRGKISRTRNKTCSALWRLVIPGILCSTEKKKKKTTEDCLKKCPERWWVSKA